MVFIFIFIFIFPFFLSSCGALDYKQNEMAEMETDKNTKWKWWWCEWELHAQTYTKTTQTRKKFMEMVENVQCIVICTKENLHCVFVLLIFSSVIVVNDGATGEKGTTRFIFMNIISAWKCYSIAGWRYFCIRFNILPNFSESRFQCARFHCVSWRLAFRDLYLSFSLSIYIVLTEQS